MSESIIAPQRSPRAWGTGKKPLLIGGLLLLALLGAILGRGLLIEAITVRALRASLGLRATVAGAGGTMFAGLELRGLSAQGERGAGPIVALTAGRIGARYNLATLLRGRAAFLDSLEVTLEGATLELDLTAPAASAADPERPITLPRLPRLVVRDGAVRVLGSGYTLEFSGLEGTVGRADTAGEQPLELRAGRCSLRHPWLREGAPAVALTGRYAPRHLTVEAARVNGNPLVERARLAFGESAGEIDLETVLDLWGGTIDFGVSRRADVTQVRWAARDVDLQPQDLLALPAVAALRGELSTTGAVRFDGAGLSSLAGELSLQWGGARLAGRDVDRLLIRATAEPGLLRVESAEGRVGHNKLDLRQVALPTGPLFEGLWGALLQETSGSFTASLGDVPAFLAFWGVKVGEDGAAVPEHRLNLAGSLGEGIVRLTEGDLATGAGKATLSAMTLTFPRGDQGWGKTAFRGRLALSLPDLSELSAILPLPPLRGSVRGEINGAGTLAHPEGGLSLTGRGIGVAGRALGDFDLRARADAGRVVVDALQVRQGKNRFSAQGLGFSADTVAPFDRQRFLESLTGGFTLAFADIPALVSLAGLPRATADRTPAGLVLKAAGTLHGRTLSVASASLTAGKGAVTVSGARLVIPGAGADWRDVTLEGLFEVDVPDLSTLAPVLPAPQPRGALRGQVRIAGRIGAPEGSVTATGLKLGFGGHEIGQVRVRAALQGRRVSVGECTVARGADNLSARGTFDLENRAVLEGEATISLADVAPWLGEYVRPGIPVSGRLHGTVRARGPLPEGKLVVAAEFAGGRLWGLPDASVATGMEITLPNGGGLALALSTLEIAAAGTRFSLEGPATIRRDQDGRIGIRGFAVSGADGRVAIEGSVAASGPNDLRVRIARLRSGSWLAGLAGERISFSGAEVDARLRGSLREPRLAVTGRVARVQGGPRGGPFAVELEAAYEPGSLRIGTLALTGAGGLEVRLAGQLPLDAAAADLLGPGKISLEGLVRAPDLEQAAFLVPDAYAVSGGLRATLRVAGSWDNPEARLEIHGERLRLPPGMPFVPPGPVTLSGAMTWRRGSVDVGQMTLASPAFSCSLAGAWTGPPELRALLAGRGDALQGKLDIRGAVSSPDLGWLQASVPGLRRIGGSVAGTIGVAGAMRDPSFTGSLRIEDGSLRYRDLPAIDRLTLDVSTAGRVVTLTDLHGNVGGSPFTIAGSADFARSDDPVLDLRLEGRDVLLYRDAGLRVRADSALSLRGPVSALTLAGELALANSLYQKNFAVTSLFTGGEKSSKRSTTSLGTISFPEPPLRDMRFDLHLTAREPFQIRTNIVRGTARPDLRLTGTGALPLLRGPVFFDKTQVVLPSGTLQLERGTVLFRESDPDRPLLDFGGRMQIRGYEITVQLGGNLDSPEIILSSVPALPNDELLLFVLTGAPPRSAGEAGASFSSLASPVAVYLGRNVLEQLFGGRNAAEKTGFQDRLELQVGREVTRSGSVTLESRFRLKEGLLDRDAVLFLTSEKDVYDQYNVGLKLMFRFR